MNGSMSRDTGSDQVDTFRELENAWSREDVPVESLTPKQAEAMRRLGDLVKLPTNWDSYGSPPPTPRAVDTVMDLLLTIDDWNLPAVLVVPVSGGGLQLEWRMEDRELQLEIAGDGTAQYLQVEDGQPPREDEILPTVEYVQALLAWLNPHFAERWAA